ARLGDARGNRLDFPELAVNEALAAEARIDAHDKYEIGQVHQVVEHVDRRARVERHTGALAQTLDQLQRAMDVRAGLRVDGNAIGPPSAKSWMYGSTGEIIRCTSSG